MISNFSQTTYIIPKGDVWRKHNPFVESHGIAREFSKLPINSKTNEIEHKDAIMFAKKYGLLGIGEGNEKKTGKSQKWTPLVGVFFDIFFFIDQNDFDTACRIFNKFGPEPQLKIRIDPKEKNAIDSWKLNPLPYMARCGLWSHMSFLKLHNYRHVREIIVKNGLRSAQKNFFAVESVGKQLTELGINRFMLF